MRVSVTNSSCGTCAPPYRDVSRAKDSVQLRQCRLPLIGLPDEPCEIVPHQRFDGSVAVGRHLQHRAEQILIQGQRRIPRHILRVAAERLLQAAFVPNFSRLPVDNLVIASRMALY